MALSPFNLRWWFPNLYMPDAKIDPRKRKRTVPMKILCLGMARTGTTSLAAALRELGYKVYHAREMFSNYQDIAWLNEAYAAKCRGEAEIYTREKFDMIYGDSEAAMSAPVVFLVDEAIAAYPEAKVIVDARNVDDWMRSMSRTAMRSSPMMGDSMAGRMAKLQATLIQWFDPYQRLLASLMKDVRHFYAYGNGEANFQENGRTLFLDYHERVRKLVPEERLLEFDPSEGWEPLCKFLGEKMPDTPFPKRNTESDFIEASAGMRKMSEKLIYKRLLLFTSGAIGLVAVVGYLVLPRGG